MTSAAASSRRPPASWWLRASQAVLFLTYVGGAVLAGFVLRWLSQSREGNLQWAWAISAIFVGLAVPLAVHDIHMHVAHFVSSLQRHYVRLIAMVPVYALASWLALVFADERAVYFEAVRDLYEAFALWSFYTLMIEFAGGRARLALRLRERAGPGGARAPCLPPLCCVRGWRLGSRFVHRVGVGLYQYVAVRALVTVGILAAQGAGAYHAGDWSPKYFYAYATMAINLSQLYALWCLAYLYTVIHDDLAPLRPLSKFALVKGIVAVTWWQGLAIQGAINAGLVPHELFPTIHDAEVGVAIGNFCYCIEMFVAGVAFHFCYGVGDFFGDTGVAPVAKMQRAEAEFDARVRAGLAAASVGGGGGGGAGGAGGGAASGPAAAAAADAGLSLHSRGGGGEDDEDEGALVAAAAGAAVDGRSIELELAPMPLSRAALDILPTDMLRETGDNVRTGFGLTHKWTKRARERRAELNEWANAHLGSTVVVAVDAGGAEGGGGGGGGGGVGGGGVGGASSPGGPAVVRAASARFATPSATPGATPASARGVAPASMRKTKSRLANSAGEGEGEGAPPRAGAGAGGGGGRGGGGAGGGGKTAATGRGV